ncbi:hypothetical protein BH11BAC2_BH11BAC2_15080 [soil metagenome]
MNARIKSLLIYIAKCVSGTLLVYLLSALLDYSDIAWCLISVILVLSADGKDSVPLAVTRIKANFVGAAVGVICLLISTTNMWILSAGLSLTLAFCYIFKLDSGIRSALAATIIIMLHEDGRHVWDSAIIRIIAVLTGCLIGLLITYLFHFNEKIYTKATGSNQQEA